MLNLVGEDEKRKLNMDTKFCYIQVLKQHDKCMSVKQYSDRRKEALEGCMRKLCNSLLLNNVHVKCFKESAYCCQTWLKLQGEQKMAKKTMQRKTGSFMENILAARKKKARMSTKF